jgi:hypothetical protein
MTNLQIAFNSLFKPVGRLFEGCFFIGINEKKSSHLGEDFERNR